MNRRSFIASLFATAVMDPERLLWIPGRKTIFVPPARPVSEIVDFVGVDWGMDNVHWQGYVIYSGETRRIIASGNLNDSHHIGEGIYRISLSANQVE